MFNIFKKRTEISQLFYSTDLHSHLIPGVDDGSRNIETSLHLIRSLNELGIKTLLITPHVTDETFMNTRETLNGPYNALKSSLSNEDIDIEIMHSAEYRLDDFFLHEVLKKKDFMLLPNNYILIENSFIQQALNFEQIVFDLKSLGFKPILAHPERYIYYINRKEQYRKLKDFEILFQVNLLSFSGYYGKEIKETAWWLLNSDMVDFIGTDMHHLKHLEQIKKFMETKEYRKLADKANILNDTAFI